MDLQLEEVDSLSGLEDRILRAVELVARLKEENAQLKQRLTAVEADARQAHAAREEVEAALANIRGNFGEAEVELEKLRTERKQVKARIEKLLGQLEALSAA